MKRALPILFAAFAAAAPPANAATGAWVAADHVRLRLVATPTADGRIDGVIEIALDAGWHTYWRDPGDAGMAPRFDFSASANLDAAEIAFPPPRRFDDGFAVSNVYEGAVALPFAAAIPEAGVPVRVKAAVDLGVCAEICLPVRLDATLDVPPGLSDPKAAALVGAARTRLPGPAAPGRFAVRDVAGLGGAEKETGFELTLETPAPQGTEVFVEAPAGWYPSPPQRVSATDGTATYRFTVDRSATPQPAPGAAFRFTVVAGDSAIEQAVPLDGLVLEDRPR